MSKSFHCIGVKRWPTTKSVVGFSIRQTMDRCLSFVLAALLESRAVGRKVEESVANGDRVSEYVGACF